MKEAEARTSRKRMSRISQIEKLLDEASASIRNIIYALVPGTTREEREDIEQEVKLKIYRKIAKGEEIRNLRSYLWKVVQTTGLDVISERLEKRTEEEIEGLLDRAHFARLRKETPEVLWEAEQGRQSLYAAVRKLPERKKAVLERWLLGFNQTEIAVALSWRENQVRHLLYDGIGDIKKTLGPQPTGTAGGAMAPDGRKAKDDQ